MPNFNAWKHDSLVQFAQEAYRRLQQQDDRIQQLQNELKDAIKAYREANANNNTGL